MNRFGRIFTRGKRGKAEGQSQEAESFPNIPENGKTNPVFTKVCCLKWKGKQFRHKDLFVSSLWLSWGDKLRPEDALVSLSETPCARDGSGSLLKGLSSNCWRTEARLSRDHVPATDAKQAWRSYNGQPVWRPIILLYYLPHVGLDGLKNFSQKNICN